jgi:hypothetical protein
VGPRRQPQAKARLRQSALHQRQRFDRIAGAMCDDSGKMQRNRLVRHHRERAIEQTLGVVQATAALLFARDAQHLGQRNPHAPRRVFSSLRCLHQSIV